jgi:disulfide bond formation protein DsbB
LAALRQLLAPTVNPRLIRTLMALGALGGLATALRQQWVIAHPTISCGMDPLETALNKIPFAQWWPTMFKADGLCSAELPPLFGISIPMWALITFVMLSIACGLHFAAIYLKSR